MFSRTKQHFIEIIHRKYWDHFDSNEYNTKEHQWSQELKRLIDKNEDKTIIKIELDKDFKFKTNYLQDNSNININFKIGKEAELIFKWLWDNKQIRELIKNKISSQLKLDIFEFNEIEHLNSINEAYEPFDFKVQNVNKNKNLFIEIKSTTKVKCDQITLSENQITKSNYCDNENNIYLVVVISNVNKIKKSINNWNNLFYALSKTKFYLFKNQMLSNSFIMNKPIVVKRKI